ncbi:unnamed protein product [Polarella glacialis]|uniref:Uncharacterized protein n=1 Tax=Polarella glacialis TaxID=89957 RepID=A0A813FIP9_POLGL|nr:unnamed protein product [Polarella glacialis]
MAGAAHAVLQLADAHAQQCMAVSPPLGVGFPAAARSAKRRKLVECLHGNGRASETEVGQFRVLEHRRATAAAGGGAAAVLAAGAGPPAWFAAAMAAALAPLEHRAAAADARSRNSGCRRAVDVLVPVPATGQPGAAVGTPVPAAFPATFGALRQLRGVRLQSLEAYYGLGGHGKAAARQGALVLHITGLRS